MEHEMGGTWHINIYTVLVKNLNGSDQQGSSVTEMRRILKWFSRKKMWAGFNEFTARCSWVLSTW
jgi:hypothetical protein